MWIHQLEFQNFRSFSQATIEFSKGINIVVGKNNSGKSTILRSLLRLQTPSLLKPSDKRYGCKDGSINISMETVEDDDTSSSFKSLKIQMPGLSAVRLNQNGATQSVQNNQTIVPTEEPNNLLYPYLSKRKAVTYNENVNLNVVNLVTGNFQNLYSKVDRISNPEFQPAYSEYIEACDKILGFRVSAVNSVIGKKAAYTIQNFDNIPIEDMGEGIPNLLGLIIDLCIAKNKIFLIEEPENDIHPQALKYLLDLISQKSVCNQFIITTHSNIVVRQLGARPNAKLFDVEMEFVDKIPTSKVREVGTCFSERMNVLENLGYELFDFGLYDGWLILEESSAEKIIRDYLMPWFVPKIKHKLKTFSARSLNQVKVKFEHFNNLFVFLHLQPLYFNKAWVIIDAGTDETKVIESFREKYSRSDWNLERFRQFSQHDFEKFYPLKFQEKVDSVLRIEDRKEKREEKKILLENLESWIAENEEEAKLAFQKSATEVIQILREIESHLI